MTDRATEYAQKVVDGKIIAGKPHIQACQRHLNDLQRQGKCDFPFVWRPEMSNRIIEFGETLTIAEGAEPKPVKLYGCQCFDLGVPMGWYNSRGNRRFRRKYKSVARQNGKTFENGIVGTYIAGFGGYHYGKLFTAATKKRQSRLAWEEMAKFIEIDPELGELFKIQDYKNLITALSTNCTIEALSKEAGLDDGFRSIFCSIDEIHQHRDNSIYKALYNGTRSLPETLVSMITTRGKNINSFCYEMDQYCLNILNGTAVAEDFFVDIYTLDEGDDPFDEAVWAKANPVLMQSESGLEVMRSDARTAKDMGGSDLSDYLAKAVNVWSQNTDNQYVDPEKLKQCASGKTLADFCGRSCYVGLDLSSGGDLTTVNLEFEEKDGGYFVHSHSFMPRGRLNEHIITDIAPYDIWEKEGLITVTGGQGDYKNDYKYIIQYLHELQEGYDLKFLGIGYDPHNADGILSDLEEFGCPLLMITQSAKFLNDATVDIQLAVKSLKLRYNRDNALLAWSFANAKTVSNSFGEIKVDKEPRARHKRIDPVDAVIDSHTVLMKTRTVETDPNEEMDEYLKMMGWS